MYLPIPFQVGTPEYWEEKSLTHFISDLYVRKMNGYKPPRTSRITIQPEYYDQWKTSNRFGSIVNIAPFYSYDEYKLLDEAGRRHYLLNLLHTSMIQLSEEHGWDRKVFEQAYSGVVASGFELKADYPVIRSRDRKKSGRMRIEKTPQLASLYVELDVEGELIRRLLLQKRNAHWYDCTYILAKNAQWFDNDRFGFNYKRGLLQGWYSVSQNQVILKEGDSQVEAIDYALYFNLQG